MKYAVEIPMENSWSESKRENEDERVEAFRCGLKNISLSHISIFS